MSTYIDEYIGLNPKKSYDAKTALSLAVLSDLAYQNAPTVRRLAKQKLKFSKCQFVNVRKGKDIDTQCFIAGNDSDIVVVFRGTDKVNDWFANFQAVRDPGPLVKTKAHEGFQDALFPSVIRVTNAIDAMLTNNQRIWVTGHSLGGALCSLYAAMMFEAGYKVYGIYTFASPRPGDAKLATALEAKMQLLKGPHHRVVNEHDIVPHVPPEPFFSHSGTRMILEKNRNVISSSGWRRIKRKIFERLMDFTDKDFWDVKGNHVLDGEDGYIERLIEQVKRSGS